MPDDHPIACSLSAPDLRARLEQMAALGSDALRGSELSGNRAQLRFADGDGVRARVEAIVAAEAECCAFLQMAVASRGDAVVLTIEAPAGTEPVLAKLVAAFGDGAPRAVG